MNCGYEHTVTEDRELPPPDPPPLNLDEADEVVAILERVKGVGAGLARLVQLALGALPQALATHIANVGVVVAAVGGAAVDDHRVEDVCGAGLSGGAGGGCSSIWLLAERLHVNLWRKLEAAVFLDPHAAVPVVAEGKRDGGGWGWEERWGIADWA